MSDESSQGSAPDPLIGRVIAGKIQLRRLLGAGAMGKVYQAHHLTLDKTVAIKVLHRAEGASAQLALRFKAEARAASRLDHPNSLRILDFGEDGSDGLLYLAMEFLEGEDLQGILQREPFLDPHRIAEIMIQVLGALSVAHQLGVVHRDMKPGNIMIVRAPGEDGLAKESVKVCDFGLAKLLDTELHDANGAPLTKQGTIMGTPAYMSPEQASGELVDASTDVYSCGVILYQLLAGRPPFTGASATSVLVKHVMEAPPAILKLRPTAHPGLARVAERAIEKAKEARWPTARDMLLAIREAVGATPGRSAAPLLSPSRSGSLEDGNAATFIRNSNPTSDASKAGAPPMAFSQPLTMASVTVAPSSPRGSSLGPILGVVALVLAGGAVALVLSNNRSEPVIESVPPPPVAEARKPVVTHPQPNPDPKPEAPPPAPADEFEAAKIEPAPKAEDRAASDEAEAPTARKSSAQRAAAARDDKKSRARSKGQDQPHEERAPQVDTPSTSAAPSPDTAAPNQDSPAAANKAEEPAGAPASPPGDESKPTSKVGPKDGSKASAEGSKDKEEPPAETKPKPEKSDKPEEAPGPKRLGSDFKLTSQIANVEVTGGLSVRQTTLALDRGLDQASSCLKAVATQRGVETAGKISVRARVDLAGVLREVKGTSNVDGAGACATQAFQGARMPKPDTGDAWITFELAFKTE